VNHWKLKKPASPKNKRGPKGIPKEMKINHLAPGEKKGFGGKSARKPSGGGGKCLGEHTGIEMKSVLPSQNSPPWWEIRCKPKEKYLAIHYREKKN